MSDLSYITSEGGRMMGSTMARMEAELVALGSILGSIMGALPAVALILGIIWYAINIYESPPVQGYLAKRRLRKIGNQKFDETVANLPETMSPSAKTIIGSLASAEAVNAAVEETHGPVGS